jgi:diguanylate cyclase (GGDEF)-like protein/PAS domain S-box-containing protein
MNAAPTTAHGDPPRIRAWLRRRLFVAAAICVPLLLMEFVAPRATGITVLYSIPVLMSSRTGNRRFTVALASITTAATLCALATTVWRSDLTIAQRLSETLDELAACLAIWAAATLGLRGARAERALRTTSTLSEVTLDSIQEAVVTVDRRDRVSRLNQAAIRLLGIENKDAVARKLADVLVLEADRRGGEDSVVAEGPSLFTGRISILKTRDGQRIPVESMFSVIHDEHGAIDGQVIVLKDISDRQRYETEIKRLAYRDELTQLPNRTSFWDRLGAEIALAKKEKHLLGLLYLDLDGFKAINDTLGHRAGDDLLRGVAERLRGAIRRGDTVARLGGDEFCVILAGLKHPADAEHVAEKLMLAMHEPIKLAQENVRAKPSIGIAIYPQDATEAEDLVHCADQAMYEAKHGGSHGRR